MKKRQRQRKPQVDILTCTCTKRKIRKSEVEEIGNFKIGGFDSEKYTKPLMSAVRGAVTKANDYNARKLSEEQDAADKYKAEYEARKPLREAAKAKYEQERRERSQWEALPNKAKASMRKTHPEPPIPQEPEANIKDEWTDAKIATKQWAKRQATPAGLYHTAAGAADLAYKGMKWVDQQRLDQIRQEKALKAQRLKEWYDIPYRKRKQIIKEQYKRRELGQKLSEIRQQSADYYMDKNTAAITGQDFRPKIFKVTTEGGKYDEDEIKYMDEYGREVPGIPEDVRKKQYKPRRSESSDIENLFGGSYKQPQIRESSWTQPTEYETLPRTRSRRESEYVPQKRRRPSESSDIYNLLA